MLRLARPLAPLGLQPSRSDHTIHSQLLSTAPNLSIEIRHLRMQRIVRSAHELGAQQTIALEPRAPGDRRRRLPLVVMPGNPASKRLLAAAVKLLRGFAVARRFPHVCSGAAPDCRSPPHGLGRGGLVSWDEAFMYGV